MPRFVDHRGFFMETFNEELFMALQMDTVWAQDNISGSFANVLRGMHIQKKNPQGKLVSCVLGRIQDVCIDLRPDSPWFGEAYSFLLEHNADHSDFVWVPPGFGHGFLSLEYSLVHYKCTTLWDKQSDGGVHPLKCGIDWVAPFKGISSDSAISAKDDSLPSLVDYTKD